MRGFCVLGLRVLYNRCVSMQVTIQTESNSLYLLLLFFFLLPTSTHLEHNPNSYYGSLEATCGSAGHSMWDHFETSCTFLKTSVCVYNVVVIFSEYTAPLKNAPKLIILSEFYCPPCKLGKCRANKKRPTLCLDTCDGLKRRTFL